jgi:thymidylate synthase ThyX
MYAKVVADSTTNGTRLTTIEVRFHRFILPEFNTHRMFSRNFSSSRAIPVAKMIEQVENEPAMPVHWGKNQAGMQANEECNALVDGRLRDVEWKRLAQINCIYAEGFSDAGYHKQIVNRLLEPFQFVKGVVTATEWDNFFALRDHPAAQPEIQLLAKLMKQAMDESEPQDLEFGEWHLPYVIGNDNLNFVMSKYLDNESMLQDKIKCSVARCARVSYMKHDKSSPSVSEDIDLYNALVTRPYTMKNGMHLPENDPIHASPAEHVATPMDNSYLPVIGSIDEEGVTHLTVDGEKWSGNFKGWLQYRQLI